MWFGVVYAGVVGALLGVFDRNFLYAYRKLYNGCGSIPGAFRYVSRVFFASHVSSNYVGVVCSPIYRLVRRYLYSFHVGFLS